jgi:hypothetical protein
MNHRKAAVRFDLKEIRVDGAAPWRIISSMMSIHGSRLDY